MWGMRSKLLKSARFAFVVIAAATGLSGCDQINFTSSDVGKKIQDYGIYRILNLSNLSTGTGFLINDKNIVVTNRHVVTVNIDGAREKADNIKIVSIFDGKFDLIDAEVVKLGFGPQEDLALLRPARPLRGRPLSIADYEPSVGSDVRAVGFPGASDTSMDTNIVTGIVQAVSGRKFASIVDKYRFIVAEYEKGLAAQYQINPAQFGATFNQGVVSKNSPYDNVPVVQHQAPINPGNSGGPLLDACGAVVGMNTFNVRGSQGIFMSLGSPWIAEQIKGAGQEVRLTGRCYFTSSSQMLPYAAGGLAVLLSLAALLFAFRRAPAVQRGFTLLTRTNRHAGGAMDRAGYGDRSAGSPTILPGIAPSSGGLVRLTPVGAGNPLSFSTERLSAASGAIVGRDYGVDGRVEEKTVSKRHAKLSLDGKGRLLIEDLNSANGTWKKGSKISKETFSSGDAVRFGSAEFKIELPSSGQTRMGTKPVTATVFAPEQRNDRPLVLSGMDTTGKTVQFSLQPASAERSWTIGRKSGEVDFVIPHPRVSSVHARIRYKPLRGFEICDLGSSNGTKLDDRKVEGDYVGLEGARKLFLGDFELNVNRG